MIDRRNPDFTVQVGHTKRISVNFYVSSHYHSPFRAIDRLRHCSCLFDHSETHHGQTSMVSRTLTPVFSTYNQSIRTVEIPVNVAMTRKERLRINNSSEFEYSSLTSTSPIRFEIKPKKCQLQRWFAPTKIPKRQTLLHCALNFKS